MQQAQLELLQARIQQQQPCTPCQGPWLTKLTLRAPFESNNAACSWSHGSPSAGMQGPPEETMSISLPEQVKGTALREGAGKSTAGTGGDSILGAASIFSAKHVRPFTFMHKRGVSLLLMSSTAKMPLSNCGMNQHCAFRLSLRALHVQTDFCQAWCQTD